MSDGKDKSKGVDFGWMLELMQKEHEKFLERVKGMPEPKYVKGDVVRFEFRDGETIEGMVEIVDRYGTFDQNEEPSYDVYRFEDNTLYKHVRESLTRGFVRHGELKEIDENAERMLEEERRAREAEKMSGKPESEPGEK